MKKVLIAAGVVALVVLGIVMAQSLWLQSRLDRAGFAGKLVDIGGRKIHLKCTGQGDRTYVLEAGATGFADMWSWVQGMLESDARVCAYDRAGLGASEARPGGFRPEGVREDLKAALDAAGERAPFVLVGHSLGGIFVRSFAAAYPESVDALVLVDPVHEDQLQRLPLDLVQAFETVRTVLRFLPVVARLGLVHVWNPFEVAASGLDAQSVERAGLYGHSPGHLRTSSAELQAWNVIMEDVRRARLSASLPVLVVSAGGRNPRQVEIARYTYPLHRELADRFPAGALRIVAEADHFTILTDRATAQRLAELIRGAAGR